MISILAVCVCVCNTMQEDTSVLTQGQNDVYKFRLFL
jgi:hypothetical protein